jgi:predicted HD superfamily hydrolase involved in NAD metabolism
MEYNFIEIQEELKKELPKKRFHHTLGVEHTSACLAMRYGANIAKAQAGGLLHDCAKCLSDQEILLRCKSSKLTITEVEERNPYLLHAKLGAEIARERYGIQDIEVLNTIIYHTTGKPNMSLLEKIVFVADYIEPSRKEIPGLSEIRKLSFIDLDKTVYQILKNTLSYLSGDTGVKEIDPLTEKAYEYYKEIIEKKGE